MKQSKTTLKELAKRYRAVLLKCALLNAVFVMPTPAARAADIVGNNTEGSFNLTEDSRITGGTFGNVTYNGTGNYSMDITGGTFTGSLTLQRMPEINLTGGNFSGVGSVDIRSLDMMTMQGGTISAIGYVSFFSQRNLSFTDAVTVNSLDYISVEASNVSLTIDGGKFTSGRYASFQAASDLVLTNAVTVNAAENVSFYSSRDLTVVGGTYFSNTGHIGFTADGIMITGGKFTSGGNTQFYTNISDLVLTDAVIINSAGYINFYTVRGNMAITGGNFTSGERTTFQSYNDLTLTDAVSVNSSDYISFVAGHGSMTIEGGKYVSKEGSITFKSAADLTLTDAVTVNSPAGIHFWSTAGAMTITGGEYVCGAGYTTFQSYNDLTLTGAVTVNSTEGINLVTTGGGNITVAGGAYTSSNASILFRAENNLNLSGNMMFSARNGTEFNAVGGSITIAGGRYSFGSGNVTFNASNTSVSSDATVRAARMTAQSILISDGKTLDIGTGVLEATSITGGILKATLTDAAKTAPMITATATNVTLTLDMSNASRDEVTLYHITDGTGFSFAGYDTKKFAVSVSVFDKGEAKTIGALNGWTGGDLYILRLMAAGEAAVEDLKSSGIPVSAAEEKAIAALNDEVTDLLAPAQKAAVQNINDLLEGLAGNAAQMKQILREIAPESAPLASSMATANAGAVMNVVGGRMGGGSPAPAAKSASSSKGRSGGDYTAGAASVWAQGLYNKADLHKADGFDADSTGFAAGFEYNVNDSVKAGVGYAYTNTDVDTARSKTDVDTHTFFAYGEYKPDAFYVNGVLSYGHSRYDETTRLAGLQSDYRANTFAGQVMAGYAVNDIVTPEAGLRYTSVRQRSYTNALGARMSSKTLDTWTWVGGVKASKDIRVDSLVVTPDAKLALTYDFRRDSQNRTVTLANGSSYVAGGENMRRFGVEIGAGVSVKVGGNTDIGLSYEGKFKSRYTDHTGLINVKYNF